MLKFLYKIIFMVSGLSVLLLATSDGPDYFKVQGVSSDDTLSVRETYDYESRKVGNLSFDADCLQNIDYFKKQGQSGWVHVKYNAIDGWVNGKYVMESDNSDCYNRATIHSDTVNTNAFKVGDYSWQTENAEATLSIKKEVNGAYTVKGEALLGTSNQYGPNIGELQFTTFMKNNVLHYTKGEYTFSLTVLEDGSLYVQTDGVNMDMGGVAFGGHYFEGALSTNSCDKYTTRLQKTICQNSALTEFDQDVLTQELLLLEFENNPISPKSFGDIVERHKNKWVQKLMQCSTDQYEKCLSTEYQARGHELDKQRLDMQTFYSRQKEYKVLIDKYTSLSLRHKKAKNNVKYIGCALEVTNLKENKAKEYKVFFDTYVKEDKTLSLADKDIVLRHSCDDLQESVVRTEQPFIEHSIHTNNSYEKILYVDAKDIVREYDNNEIAADNRYKGKEVEVTGIISDIKKDIMGSLYVSLGTGGVFEMREVQAYFNDDMNNELARLRKGSRLTVRCVADGLMVNVLMKECLIVSK